MALERYMRFVCHTYSTFEPHMMPQYSDFILSLAFTLDPCWMAQSRPTPASGAIRSMYIYAKGPHTNMYYESIHTIQQCGQSQRMRFRHRISHWFHCVLWMFCTSDSFLSLLLSILAFRIGASASETESTHRMFQYYVQPITHTQTEKPETNRHYNTSNRAHIRSVYIIQIMKSLISTGDISVFEYITCVQCGMFACPGLLMCFERVGSLVRI